MYLNESEGLVDLFRKQEQKIIKRCGALQDSNKKYDKAKRTANRFASFDERCKGRKFDFAQRGDHIHAFVKGETGMGGIAQCYQGVSSFGEVAIELIPDI